MTPYARRSMLRAASLQLSSEGMAKAVTEASELIDAQERELADLRRDKLRLDWLSTNPVALIRDNSDQGTYTVGRSDNFQNYAERMPSARAAIDAAMEAAK